MFYAICAEQINVHFLFNFVQMEILFFVIAITLAAAAIRHNARRQAERDALATRQTYEHVTAPIMVTSDFPDDPTVMQRAQAWREKLRAAGNRYSETLPIVPYPFALGASASVGSLGTWLTYRRNCLLKEAALIAEWEQKMMKENDPLFVGNILHQQPGQN